MNRLSIGCREVMTNLGGCGEVTRVCEEVLIGCGGC